MSMNMHCDGPDCNAWVPPGFLAEGWLTVEGWTEPLHFCYWDCLLRFAAAKEPLEQV